MNIFQITPVFRTFTAAGLPSGGYREGLATWLNWDHVVSVAAALWDLDHDSKLSLVEITMVNGAVHHTYRASWDDWLKR